MHHAIRRSLGRRLATIAAVAVTAIAAACGGDDEPTGVGNALLGVWHLMTVNGQPLPIVEHDTQQVNDSVLFISRTQIDSVSLALQSNSRYRALFAYEIEGHTTDSSFVFDEAGVDTTTGTWRHVDEQVLLIFSYEDEFGETIVDTTFLAVQDDALVLADTVRDDAGNIETIFTWVFRK